MSDDDLLQAVLARDKHQDGSFYYGVASTGIYCRPSCPSRKPNPVQVRFFSTCAEAERAGFRACKRCRPKDIPMIAADRLPGPLELTRRLAAILSLDVAGFSRLMEDDEGGTYAALRAHRTAVLDPAIAARRGRIVKTVGDGMLIEFVSVIDAVRCAVDIQQGMLRRNSRVPNAARLDFRIGINIAEIIVEPDDIYGDGVNIADRLQALSPVGGICVSHAVRDQICGKLPYGFDDLGEQRVKSIVRPIRAFNVRFVGSDACEPKGAEVIALASVRPAPAALVGAPYSPALRHSKR
jgi:class 3 adenylate cyclase